jgi:hypothetical protein
MIMGIAKRGTGVRLHSINAQVASRFDSNASSYLARQSELGRLVILLDRRRYRMVQADLECLR